MKLQSPAEHRFSQVPRADVQRSVFDRSHCHKFDFSDGFLVPFYVDEALPGDTFNLKATLFARLAPGFVPFMDNLYLDTFYFAVPLRLVWSNFEKFMGEAEPGDLTNEFLIPQVVAPTNGFGVNTIYDYFGVAPYTTGISISALFGRAYNLIYNEWFRDQNIIASAVVDLDDGPDTATDYVLRRRGKRHDYFTSCLPWPQKSAAVEIPLSGMARIEGLGVAANTGWSTGPTSVWETDAAATVPYAFFKTTASTALITEGDGTTSTPKIYANLDSLTGAGATISSLREAFQLQKFYERDARGGTRYTEVIRAHFNVVSPDARLQRPEFLGGKSTPIMLSAVANTTPSSEASIQAFLASHGQGASVGEGFVKSFTEHSIVMGIIMLRADLTYQQGIPRMFSRRTRFDFYWPTLAHLSEQAVLRKEIFVPGDQTTPGTASANDDIVFGYQERYAEYRYFPSVISGQMRSTNATPTDMWHAAQEFATAPTLSQAFIEEDVPIGRIVDLDANQSGFFQPIVMDAYLKLRCVRPMPVYSIPGLADHF